MNCYHNNRIILEMSLISKILSNHATLTYYLTLTGLDMFV